MKNFCKIKGKQTYNKSFKSVSCLLKFDITTWIMIRNFDLVTVGLPFFKSKIDIYFSVITKYGEF